MLRLTNTLTGKPEVFEPLDKQTVRMYTCGPTVYNFVHIGNLRTFVWEDILRRHLASKWKIKHVMNITDIDDKIIKRSLETGQDIKSYTAPYTSGFFEDCRKLRIEKPEIVAPATEHIEEMIDLVSRLLAAGYAYREGDSIYYRISRFPTYGRLSNLDKRELKVGARIDADEYVKEEPRDFVLWKAPKDSREPRWPAPFGEGRPGWHLECSAMAMKYLGQTLDLHCGGVDLLFPHHENEIAQSEAVTGRPFVRFWIHGEHLLVDGEKMAKSRGNFFTLRDLLDEGYDPLTVRYLLVSVRYRKQLNFTFDGLKEARAALDRIKEFLFRLSTATLKPGNNPNLAARLASAREQFEASLDDDLNTSGALGAMFVFIGEANVALAEGHLQEDNRAEITGWFKVIDERLAIVPPLEHPVQDDREAEEIERLVRQRNEARSNRDFALSDKIRQELLDRGVVIEDTREGTRWRRK
jgi:cysteinyl-tRNA synthetase